MRHLHVNNCTHSTIFSHFVLGGCCCVLPLVCKQELNFEKGLQFSKTIFINLIFAFKKYVQKICIFLFLTDIQKRNIHQYFSFFFRKSHITIGPFTLLARHLF